MDRVVSTRLSEAAVNELDRLARRLKLSKKQLLEQAIWLRVKQVEDDELTDVWTETLGAWRREETVTETIAEARQSFNRSFERHQRDARVRR